MYTPVWRVAEYKPPVLREVAPAATADSTSVRMYA